MQHHYLKNAQISRKYNVSTATVSRWFRLAVEGKYKIELEQIKGKTLAKDTISNHEQFAKLSRQGIKYKSSQILKKIVPGVDFYKYFTDTEILQIYNDLKYEKRIDRNFTFHGLGAQNWNENIVKGIKDKRYSIAIDILKLVNNFVSPAINSLDKNTSYNIVDTAPFSYPLSFHLLKLLIKNGIKINTYTAVTSSAETLKIVKKEFDKLFSNIKFEECKINLINNNCSSILLSNSIKYENSKNLIINLGNELGNFRSPYLGIDNSIIGIQKEDLLLFTYGVYKQITDWDKKFMGHESFNNTLQEYWILHALGINIDNIEYEVEPSEYMKKVYFKIDKDYECGLKIGNLTKTLEFKKGDRIEVLRYYSTELETLFDHIKQVNKNLNLMYYDKTNQDNSNAILVFCNNIE